MIALYGYYGYSYGYGYDPMYILLLISFVIALVAQFGVKSAFSRNSSVQASCGMTGAAIAETLLRNEGIYDVSIQRISGSLTDNYNPKTKVLSLSDSVYNSTSVSAISVAAHETGHAIQHAKGYAPLSFRTALFPVANFGSRMAWVFIALGFVFSTSSLYFLVDVGIVLFSLAVLFQIVTLPVEFNASARALRLLKDGGYLSGRENGRARTVLTAAAMTYVAATATAIIQLLRLISLFGGRRRD